MSELSIAHYLRTIADHGIYAWEQLLAEGHHPKVIVAKAEKAIRKGYIECGVSARRTWLTDQGRDFLEREGNA